MNPKTISHYEFVILTEDDEQNYEGTCDYIDEIRCGEHWVEFPLEDKHVIIPASIILEISFEPVMED